MLSIWERSNHLTDKRPSQKSWACSREEINMCQAGISGNGAIPRYLTKMFEESEFFKSQKCEWRIKRKPTAVVWMHTPKSVCWKISPQCKSLGRRHLWEIIRLCSCEWWVSIIKGLRQWAWCLLLPLPFSSLPHRLEHMCTFFLALLSLVMGRRISKGLARCKPLDLGLPGLQNCENEITILC